MSAPSIQPKLQNRALTARKQRFLTAVHTQLVLRQVVTQHHGNGVRQRTRCDNADLDLDGFAIDLAAVPVQGVNLPG